MYMYSISVKFSYATDKEYYMHMYIHVYDAVYYVRFI